MQELIEFYAGVFGGLQKAMRLPLLTLILIDKRRLAPFVSPVVQARPITEQGSYERRYIKAPYLKPSLALTPDTVTDSYLLAKLQADGVIGNGKLSAAEKLRVAQINTFGRLRQSIDNRKKLMAVDILTKGKTLIIGDDYPAYEIDFGRDKNLIYSPISDWTDSSATPITDIETMLDHLVQTSGLSPKIALMGSGAFNALAKSGEFKERFVRPLGANAPDPFAPKFARTDHAQFRGELDGIAFYTYDVAHNLGGTRTRFIGNYDFYLIADTEGYQAQCEIKHLDVLGSALDYYDYQVVQRDPSVIKLICESSPLILPSNVNGVIGGKMGA